MEVKSKKKGKVTKANICSLLGFVLLFVFTFLGALCMTLSFGSALIWSCSITVLSFLILLGLVYTKTTENEFKLMKLGEYVLLLLFIVMSIVVFPPISQFVHVTTNRSELQTIAKNDIAKIDSMLVSYEEFYNKAISASDVYLTGMIYDLNKPKELSDFFNKREIKSADRIQENIINEAKDNILGKEYKELTENYKNQKSDWNNIISGWNIFKMDDFVNKFKAYSRDITNRLNEMPQNEHLAIGDAKKKTWISDVQYKQFDVVPTSDFETSFKDYRKFGIVSWLLFVIIEVLVLSNYIFAIPSLKQKIGHTQNDGGHLLI